MSDLNTLAAMSDQEIMAHLDALGNQISWHNAAEGADYFKEYPLLVEAKFKFYLALAEAKDRGLGYSTEGKGFLL